MRDVRSVALGVYVAGGSADEEPAVLGSTHFLEHLLFRRSRRRVRAPRIARTTDRLGGDCDAYTTKEWMAVHARTPVRAAGRRPRAPPRPDRGARLHGRRRRDRAEGDPRGDGRGERRPGGPPPRDLRPLLLARPPARRADPRDGGDGPARSTGRASSHRFRELFRPEKTLLVAVGAFEPEALPQAPVGRAEEAPARAAGARPARRPPRRGASPRGRAAPSTSRGPT